LPIIQGPTFTFLIPTLSILSLPQWKCDLQNINETNTEEYSEAWKMRMREVQGALIVASLVEVIIGCTGIMGLLLQFITPLSIVPAISLIGLSLFQEAAGPAGQNWLFSGLTMILLILFSQYLNKVKLQTPFYSRKQKFHLKPVKIFEIF
ncbi:solute carrier family 23 member 2-like protein, partial [Leptotrombidium deliense]